MPQSIEDFVGVVDNGMKEAQEAIVDLIDDGLVPPVSGGSPHGDGELGQEDEQAQRDGYQGIEEQKNLTDLAEELRRKGEMDEGAILDLIESMKSAVDVEEGEEPAVEDEEDEDPAAEADRLAKEQAPDRDDPTKDYFDAADIEKQLGEDALIRVKVDGEYIDVTPAEMLSGYSRTASFTQKAQSLAQERKAFADQQQELLADAHKVQEQMGFAAQILARAGADANVLGAMEQMYTAAASQNAKAQAAIKAQNLELARQQLPAIIPGWHDEAVVDADQDAMYEAGLAMGFSESDMAGVTDPKNVLLLWKAAQYDRLEAARDTVRAKAKKAPRLQPGQSKRRPAAKKASEKRKAEKASKLRRSGSTHDAASLIFDTLED